MRHKKGSHRRSRANLLPSRYSKRNSFIRTAARETQWRSISIFLFAASIRLEWDEDTKLAWVRLFRLISFHIKAGYTMKSGDFGGGGGGLKAANNQLQKQRHSVSACNTPLIKLSPDKQGPSPASSSTSTQCTFN